jgi:hypothetical protein
VPSTCDSSPVATGLLLLGTGRDSRKEIEAHYRPVAKRERLQVVVEVRVPVPRSQRVVVTLDTDDDHDVDGESRKWRLEARWLEARVFVWRGAVEGNGQSWELGEAIAGLYDGGDRGEVEVKENVGVVKDEVGEEEVGLGDLRLDGDSEWA